MGLLVVLCSAGLWWSWAEFLPANTPAASWAEQAASLAIFLGLYLAVSLPLDWLGGYFLPAWFDRPKPPLGRYFFGWARGALSHGVFLVVGGFSLMAGARLWGLTGVMLAATAGMGLLVLGQYWIARFVASLPKTSAQMTEVADQLSQWGLKPPERVTIADNHDPGFVGGVVLSPLGRRLILPGWWLRSLPAETVAVQVVRRMLASRSSLQLSGILVAVCWNLSGLGLVSWLFGAPTHAAALVTVSLAWTLWSFLGLLLLPSVSRPGVLAVDKAALRAGIPQTAVAQSIRPLDQLQDDEPSRSRLIETIFHPIPAADFRLESLNRHDSPSWGAWNAARVALYLSWPCLGLLSRAVHCNSGRPELWVFFPGD